MRKCIVIALCVLLLISAMPVYAAEPAPAGETAPADGITCVTELIVENQNARSAERTATRRDTFYDGDTVIAVIAFQATFRFDGNSVNVIAMSVTETDTYEGWSYKQTSFTSSGGTVTLEGKLTKWLIFNSAFTMSMTCDKNGTISY